jgi:hypothetical protein
VLAAQRDQRVRVDMEAERLAEWILLLLDGFAGRVAASDDFVAERETRTLNEQVASLLGNCTQRDEGHRGALSSRLSWPA